MNELDQNKLMVKISQVTARVVFQSKSTYPIKITKIVILGNCFQFLLTNLWTSITK